MQVQLLVLLAPFACSSVASVVFRRSAGLCLPVVSVTRACLSRVAYCIGDVDHFPIPWTVVVYTLVDDVERHRL